MPTTCRMADGLQLERKMWVLIGWIDSRPATCLMADGLQSVSVGIDKVYDLIVKKFDTGELMPWTCRLAVNQVR